MSCQRVREKEEINIQFRKARKARLERPLAVQNASSNVFDMINCLRRINSQVTSRAYSVARDELRVEQAHSHGSDIEGEEIWPLEVGAGQREKNA